MSSIAVIIFTCNNIQKNDYHFVLFFLGTIANNLLRNFITAHWKHF